jgi:WD40 repeat protein
MQESCFSFERFSDRHHVRPALRQMVVSQLFLLVAVLTFISVAPMCVAGDPPITAAVFTPDRQAVVVGSQAGVRRLSWPKLDDQRGLETALQNIHHVAFSPDHQRLLISGGVPAESGTIEIYRTSDYSLEKSIVVHHDLIYEAAWSPDGSKFATASADGFCKVIHTESGEIAAQFRGHSKAVLTVTFLDTEKCVSGGVDQTIRLWNVHDGSSLRTLNNHVNTVNRLESQLVLQDQTNQLLVSISEDSTCRLWQPEIGRLMKFTKLPSIPRCLSELKGSEIAYVGTDDGSIYKVDLNTMKQSLLASTNIGRIHELLVDFARQTLFVSGQNGFQSIKVDSASGENSK